jgi:2-keto-4-pentenoate hydratase
MDKIQKAADVLVDLRKSPRTVDAIPTEFYPEILDQAYEIQNALVKGLLSHFGGKQIGYKIACTNILAQELLNVESLVADNAIHGAWIRGERHKNWREFDLSVHDVQLFVNGKITEKGSGAAVLGHPLNAVAWLANELPKHDLSLKAGDLVTTGVATNVYFAETGDKIQADFGALGTVDLDWV